MNIDREQIDRGQKIHRMLNSGDADPLLVEWEARVQAAEERRAAWHPFSAPAAALAYAEAEVRTLREFRDWLFAEVEAGADELKKKNEDKA